MSESAILGLAAIVATIVGTLGGVWLGSWLQRSADEHRRLEDACAEVIASALETTVLFAEIEVSIVTGQPAPEVRSEVAREWFLALARVGLSSTVIADAAARLSTAMAEATAGQAKQKPEERLAARASAMKAIEAFQGAVSSELGRRWLRK